MVNHGKSWKNMGKRGKSWEIMGNHGKTGGKFMGHMMRKWWDIYGTIEDCPSKVGVFPKC